MSTWLEIFRLDIAVALLAGLVLLLDALLPASTRFHGYLVTLGLLATLALSFAAPGSGSAPHGTYVTDAWVLFLKRTFLVAGVLGVLGSMEWVRRKTPKRQAEYYALLLFSLVGMMLLPGVRDWILLVTCFELMSVPLYVLCAFAKNDVVPTAPGEKSLAAEAGLKLFVTGAASSAITLFGLALVTGASGSSSIAASSASPTPLTAVGMLLVIAGLGFKVGAVPFHMWVPDAYQGAPMPFVAFLSVAPKAAGLATFAVVLLSGWAKHAPLWVPAIGAIAGASMVVGNLFALPQSDVRRLLGFSGVAQIGYVLLALCAGTERGLAMALFFIATYVFTNFGVFLVAHAAAQESGGHTLDRLAGLSRRSPWLGAALLVFLLSLAGIPFVAGFWAKVFVFLAAYEAGFLWLVVIGVAFAVVGLFYYLTVARSTFMSDGSTSAEVKPNLTLGIAIVASLAAVIGFGLWPAPLVSAAETAAHAFLASR